MTTHDSQSGSSHAQRRAGDQPTQIRKQTKPKREADERDLERAAAGLQLPAPVATYVNYRILPYARFCENQANGSRLTYYWLRISAIVLAAIVPALVAANLGGATRWIATGLSILVAGTTGTEHFLNVGARWGHYRATVRVSQERSLNVL